MLHTSYKSYDLHMLDLLQNGTSSDIQVKAFGTTTSSQVELLDEEMAQKLIAWRLGSGSESEGECDCESECYCEGDCVCECAGHIEKCIVLSFELEYSDKDFLFGSMFISKLADSNINGDFEIELKGLRSRKSLCAYFLASSCDYERTWFKSLDLKNPLDNTQLWELSQLIQNMERKMIPFGDHERHPHTSYFGTSKRTNDFTSIVLSRIKSGLSFKHVGSLKELRLSFVTVAYKCFNSLPDTLL
ncbi:unnamed protein product [Ambrosiozyma monospora]|uniref:Unnamed protein product n=1 Tax=Ambrosiozyma monospora TaxID=43982 RepID=A0ACB5TWB8_AMBMO|nr:unnamed protein product [Ambrosiozyma monospora]